MLPTSYTDEIRFFDPSEILLTNDTPLLLYYEIVGSTDGAHLLVVRSELGYQLGVGKTHFLFTLISGFDQCTGYPNHLSDTAMVL